MDYNFKYSKILPPLTQDVYYALKADIKQRGILVPVIIDEDRNVIDGQHRLIIANELGIKDVPLETKVNLSDSEKQQLAIDLNLHRRHLTSDQRAVMAIEASELVERLEREAKERQDTSTGGAEPQLKEKIPEGEHGNGQARDKLATIFNTNGKYIDTAKRVRKKAPKLFEQVKSGDVSLIDANILSKMDEDDRQEAQNRIKKGEAKNAKVAKNQIKKEKQIADIENVKIPEEKYHIIVIDPPWKYNNRAQDETHRAANPYPDMTVNEIKEWGIEQITTLAFDDCILWLWTTNAFMKEAHEIASCWGFEIKTILTWVKSKMGLGDWLRGKTEHCLMCVKGKPVINLTNQTTVINGPLREHSRKPDEFYELVDQLCIGRKLDVFAREPRNGWNSYGNEIKKFNGF